jgi:hypothetical protein
MRANLAPSALRPRFFDLWRAQQAADVVGAKGWLSASAHRMCSST